MKLRKLSLADLEDYKYWKLPIHKYHEFNGPYFSKKTKEEVEQEIENLKNQIGENKGIHLCFKRR